MDKLRRFQETDISIVKWKIPNPCHHLPRCPSLQEVWPANWLIIADINNDHQSAAGTTCLWTLMFQQFKEYLNHRPAAPSHHTDVLLSPHTASHPAVSALLVVKCQQHHLTQCDPATLLIILALLYQPAALSQASRLIHLKGIINMNFLTSWCQECWWFGVFESGLCNYET